MLVYLALEYVEPNAEYATLSGKCITMIYFVDSFLVDVERYGVRFHVWFFNGGFF